jgi:hypothetical protein
MARGWESKSVESQIDSATAARMARQRPPKTPDELQRESKVHGLMLSRTRVLNDLQHACNARYRAQLEQALAFLDQQIAELELIAPA